MARNQNTFAKQQREIAKKRKAEQKRMRRMERKAAQVTSETEAGDSEDRTTE